MPRTEACCSSSLLGVRLEAAISQTPATRPQNPEPLPLVSMSIAQSGWFFLYSATSRGANSSPTVLDPLMATFAFAAGGGLLLSEQPDNRRPRRPARPKASRLKLERQAQKVAFMDVFHLEGVELS